MLPTGFHGLNGNKKHDAIINLPDPRGFVQSLAAEDLYLLIQDIGPADCTDLMELATNKQRQSFIDLDCWVGDELDIESFDRWLDLITEGSLESLIETLGSLDPELMVAYLMQSVVTVLDRSQEDEIQAYEDQTIVIPSPDLDFRLVFRNDEDETAPRINHIVKQLYRYDLDYARNILNSCRTGLKIENTELARRFRMGRLADMGFPEPSDAYALYAAIPIETVKKALETQPEPSILDNKLNSIEWALSRTHMMGSFLNDCLARITHVDRVARDFAFCVNRAIVASPEGLMLRDLSRLEHLGRSVHSTISLGLEYLSDGDVDRGTQILDQAWLLQLFQVGHRLTVKRSVRARELMNRGGGLLPDNILALITSLQVTPQPCFVDQHGQRVTFGSRADLNECDRLLTKGETLCNLFEEHFGFSIERFKKHIFAGLTVIDKRFVRFSTLACTMLAHSLIEDGHSFEPIDVSRMSKMLARIDQLPNAVNNLVSTFSEDVRELLEHAAQTLTEELGSLNPSEQLKPGMMMGILLLKDSQDSEQA